jgi:hypothetical protein
MAKTDYIIKHKEGIGTTVPKGFTKEDSGSNH